MDLKSLIPIIPLVLSSILTFIESLIIPRFSEFSPTLIESLLFFLLQFLTFTIIEERLGILRRIEHHVKKERELFRDRRDFQLEDILNKAKKSIWIVALSFGYLLNVEKKIIERKYLEGREIKLLLLNPEKIYDAYAISGYSDEELSREIETSIEFIKKYYGRKSDEGGTIEGKLLPSFPGFGVFITDGNTSKGEVKIELILNDTTPSERPNCIITREDPNRYQQMIRHFENLWENSDPILN